MFVINHYKRITVLNFIKRRLNAYKIQNVLSRGFRNTLNINKLRVQTTNTVKRLLNVGWIVLEKNAGPFINRTYQT
jgi:hypothetical protein